MKPPVFEIIQIDVPTQNFLECRVLINAEHQIYKGHFPGNPITPGVIFLHILKQLLQQHLGKKFLMSEIKKAKFLEIMDPNSETELIYKVDFTENNGIYTVKNKTTFTNATVVFNCNATFVEMSN